MHLVRMRMYGKNSRLAKNTLGQFMKNISKMASLSEQYTNNAVRSTSITVLDDAGFEARHIIGSLAITGNHP